MFQVYSLLAVYLYNVSAVYDKCKSLKAEILAFLTKSASFLVKQIKKEDRMLNA